MVIQPQDAAYIVKELREILRLEEKENMDNKNKSQQSSSSRTGLYLNNICFSSNALYILCTFLQQTDHNLTALHLGSMHSTEFLPILAALQHSNNKSVQALTISRGGRTTLSTGLVQLLQSKSDSLQALNFVNVDFGGDFLQGCGILSCLGRSTLPDLRKLSFTACCIDDDGIESIIEALVSELVDDNVDNTRPHGQQRQRRHFVSSPVQELDFSNNDIASGGLQRSLCTYAVQFPRLEKLNLSGNQHLLADGNVTRLFVDTFLLSNHHDKNVATPLVASVSSSLKELNIADCCAANDAGCSSAALAYCLFIQAALEGTSDCALEVLDISCAFKNDPFRSDFLNHRWVTRPFANPFNQWQWKLRNQLVDSLPNVNNGNNASCGGGGRRRCLCKLVVDEGLIDEQDLELMSAFCQNTSLLQLSHRDARRIIVGGSILHGRSQHMNQTPCVCAALKRNYHLQQIEILLGRSLLRTTVTPAAQASAKTASTRLPCLQDGLWSHVLSKVGKGHQSGTVLFLLLQDQLATWSRKEESTIQPITTFVATSSSQQPAPLPKNRMCGRTTCTSQYAEEEDESRRRCSFFRTTRGVFGKSSDDSSNSIPSKVVLGSCRGDNDNRNFIMFLRTHRPWQTLQLHSSLSWQQHVMSMHPASIRGRG
jgi:hypothetical protein